MNNSDGSQLYPMVKGDLHIGDFVKSVLVNRHINRSSMAKALHVSPAAVEGYLRATNLSDAVLVKMSHALQFDLYGMVQAEKAKRLPKEAKNGSLVKEPPVKYGTDSPTGSAGVTIVLHMEEYDEDTALKIFRFLSQQPKKAK